MKELFASIYEKNKVISFNQRYINFVYKLFFPSLKNFFKYSSIFVLLNSILINAAIYIMNHSPMFSQQFFNIVGQEITLMTILAAILFVLGGVAESKLDQENTKIKSKIHDFLKQNQDSDEVLKEGILKFDLILKLRYQESKRLEKNECDNLIDFFKNKEIYPNTYIEMAQWLSTKDNQRKFLEYNDALIELSNDELENKIKTNLANLILEEEQKAQQRLDFAQNHLNQTIKKENHLFLATKTLKNTL
jgi:hypothetical protein